MNSFYLVDFQESAHIRLHADQPLKNVARPAPLLSPLEQQQPAAANGSSDRRTSNASGVSGVSNGRRFSFSPGDWKAAREERDQPVLPMKHEDREYPSLRFYYGGAWDGQYGGYHGSDKASDPPPLLRGWFDDKPPKDRSSSVGSGSTLKGDDEPVVKCVSRPPPLVVHG